MNQIILILVVLILIPAIIQNIDAEPILITKSSFIDDVTFDGKWTNGGEWKASSVDFIAGSMYLRSAHQDDFMYLMIDVVEDTTPSKNSDRGMICFDTNNEKSEIADENDYCFISTLGSHNAITLQGGTPFASKDHFRKIKNLDELVIVGGVSGENNRYVKTQHAIYEFKIPLDLIGRSDNYGFLVYVYDANKNQILTYPESIPIEDNRSIPSPKYWGDIISPDKSLPEFHSIMILLVILFGSLSLIRLKPFFGNLFS
jgi:hypothetical protein